MIDQLANTNDPDFKADLTEAISVLRTVRAQISGFNTNQEALFGVDSKGQNHIIFFKNAVKAFLNGSKADKLSGYSADLKAGDHAIKGLIGHEIAHGVRRLNFGANGKKLKSKVLENNADQFLKKLYPGEY